MTKPVKKTASSDETKELNFQQPDQPENSRSIRVRKSEQRGIGEKMVEVQGKTKVEGSSYQRYKGRWKRKAGINAGINDQKIQLEEFLKLRRQYDDLRNTNEEFVKENERLKSKETALEQQIEKLKNVMEHMRMDVDIPKDMDSSVDPIEMDLSEGKTSAPIPLPSPKEGLAIDKLITQATETSQTEVLESYINQYLDQSEKMRATDKKLERESAMLISNMKILKEIDEDFVSMNDDLSDAKLLDEIDALFPLPPPKGGLARNKLITQGTGCSQTEVLETDKEQIQAELAKIDNKIPSACCNEELATNKHVTACKNTTEGALKLKREREDKLSEVPKGKLPMAIDGTSTCCPTSSTFSIVFISIICQLILQFATVNHPLSTAEDAESREAIHDKQASTSALGIRGTIDVLALEKHMENSVSHAYYFALKIVFGKLLTAVDGTSTCRPTSRTFSSNFISNICQLILQFATQNQLLSTARDAELREATHDKQASTSALGIRGTTDFRELEKHMENGVSNAYYFALEIARAGRESRAVNAKEEDGANQAIETADGDN